MYDESSLVYLSFPMWIASYGLLSLKTLSQLNGTHLMPKKGVNAIQMLFSINSKNIHQIYGGVTLYVILNTFLMTQMPILRSNEYKEREVESKIKEVSQMFNG